jgi:hypothetical protein
MAHGKDADKGSTPESSPRRMVGICTDLGYVPDYFFPKNGGRNYKASPYLEIFAKHRDNFTVFSNVSHPEVNGGHLTDVCFLTGALQPRKPGFKNSISIDQLAANHFGPATRFPSLTLRVGPGNVSLSYTGDGVRIPADERPSDVYRKLFIQGTQSEIEQQVARLQEGRSLMDSFGQQITTLSKQVGVIDRQRLDQYTTAFRELEQRLHENEAWEQRPKPKTAVSQPKDITEIEDLVGRTRQMYDMILLALMSDSTRAITVFVTQQFNPKVDLPDVDLPHHALTHQQNTTDGRAQLAIIERAQLSELNRLLDGLSENKEGKYALLDRTMVLYGSNMGNAATHDNHNLPLILAGGGFKHGQHLIGDAKNNTPLANIQLSMLQRLGLPMTKFATSTGSMQGLELLPNG